MLQGRQRGPPTVRNFAAIAITASISSIADYGTTTVVDILILSATIIFTIAATAAGTLVLFIIVLFVLLYIVPISIFPNLSICRNY